jgi:hypothetical protein
MLVASTVGGTAASSSTTTRSAPTAADSVKVSTTAKATHPVVTSGRVIWVAGARSGGGQFERTVSVHNGQLALGDAHPLHVTLPDSVQDRLGNQVAVDGDRTAYVGLTAAHEAVLVVESSVTMTTIALPDDQHFAHHGVGAISLVAHHVLVATRDFHADAPALLVDIPTKSVQTLGGDVAPGFYGPLTSKQPHAALTPRYLAYARSNSIWRQDLTTGKTVRVVGGGSAIVFAHGSWVGWDSHFGDRTPGYRNATTMSHVATLPQLRKNGRPYAPRIVQFSDAGILFSYGTTRGSNHLANPPFALQRYANPKARTFLGHGTALRAS